MQWGNPYKQDLDTELTFPLSEGCTISGYALESQGKLIDGVIVSKTKAKKTYEMQVKSDATNSPTFSYETKKPLLSLRMLLEIYLKLVYILYLHKEHVQ